MSEYKLVILGDGGVGKSASVIQFTSNHFVEEYDPTIEDSYRKRCTIDDEACVLDILDTAGEEEYAAIREQYMRGGQAFLMMYSITSRRSLDKLSELRDQLLKVKDEYYVPMVLAGNKCDLGIERQVSTEEGREIANLFGCPFFETSAKERINIQESYYEVVREFRKQNMCVAK